MKNNLKKKNIKKESITELVISGIKSGNAEHKKFQSALEKLNKLKSEMAYFKGFQVWSISEYHKIIPEIEKAYWQARKEQIFCYDAFLNVNRKKISKKMVEAIEEIIFHDIDEVGMGINYEGLEELKQKYESDEDREDEKMMRLEKAAEVSKNLGFEVDPEDILIANSPEAMKAFFEKYQEKMAEARKKFAEAKINSKSKEEQEAETLLKTDISKLFKQLAVEIHPDYETDETLREQKEILMKELTAARDNQDILELLKIKNKVAIMLDKATDDIDNKAIKRFVKLIKSQCIDLKEDLAMMSEEVPYGHLMRYSKELDKDKKKYLVILKDIKRIFTKNTNDIKLDIRVITEAPNTMDYHIRKRQDLIIREMLQNLHS